MEVINTNVQKRETYSVMLERSLVWEAVLGIAAATNESLLSTLEEPWESLCSTFDEQLQEALEHVKKYNTWKSLLQITHASQSGNLADWERYVQSLSDIQLKEKCLPYIDSHSEEKVKEVAKGSEEALRTVTDLVVDHPFYPGYIRYIAEVDTELLKEHLVNVMKGWWNHVIEPDKSRLTQILERDYQTKCKEKEKMHPETFVEWATLGRDYKPEPSVHHVLLIPHVAYRPWNVEADLPDTKVIYYPVSEESMDPAKKDEPKEHLLRPLKVLGDATRLKMLRKMAPQSKSLKELTEEMEMGKTTIHHHLKLMKAARVVHQEGASYSINRQVLDKMHVELLEFLNLEN
ncbi:ArsR/SmtB family transcription factor [Halobacillus salinus]|uniref:ArsR family transcriptional regulator n=1 Tax=Halobacillus salinus TaxID=192814 RepID=A0A4Z0H4M9_9BACI|nr:ArsR family transcriptional regulator [Halobacillus salinus]TGB04411.1 ArsR family transcriptional regulator [Halobacillus salinus]